MKLPLKEKIAFGLADTGSSLVVGTTMSFLLYYYTESYGLSAAAAGTLLLGVRLTDGVIDLFVGVAADRTHTRWGKFRPWLLWSAGPLSVIAVLTFTRPPWSHGAKLVYAWITYLLLMVAFSAMSVPLGALSAVMTDDTHERTSLNGIRAACAGIGGVLAAVATLPLINMFSGAGGDRASGYQRTMIIYGGLAFIMIIITFLGTRERVRAPSDQSHDLFADLSMLRQNRPWFVVTLAATLSVAVAALRSAAVLYYFKYYIGREFGATLFFTISTLSVILGALLSAPLSRRLGKRAAFQLGAFAASAFYALVMLVPRSGLVFLETINVLGSIAAGSITPLLFSMLADTADYGDWKCRRRSAGIIFSALSLGFKAGFGLGGALTGALLVAFGYVAGAVQAEGTVRGIVLMMSVIPALGLVLVGFLMRLYSLDERTSAVIRSDLAHRKAHSVAV